MTREEFSAKWVDWLAGRMLAGFVEGERGDWAARGRHMVAELRKARVGVIQMWEDAQQPKPEPLANGQLAPKQELKR